MVKLKLFLLTSIFIILLNISTSFGTEYKCDLYEENTRCEISGLAMTRDNHCIEPRTDNRNAITYVNLEGSVPVLSSCVCDVLPNLLTFYANSVSIEEVKENAFGGCKKLNYINLDGNNFKKLHRNTFNGLRDLKKLYLSNGNVPFVDFDLSSLVQLEVLNIMHFKMPVFPADILREQINLKTLILSSNNLFDLDIERVLNYAPNLKEIYLTDNNFKCSRIEVIISLLRQKNIYVSLKTYNAKQRDYKPEKYEGIDCLTEQQWESELAKFPSEQQRIIRNAEKPIIKPVPDLTASLEELRQRLDNFMNEQMKENKIFSKFCSNIDTVDSMFRKHLEDYESLKTNIEYGNLTIKNQLEELNEKIKRLE